MKVIKNKLNGQIAHVDIITETKGILNTYENEASFWSSQAPINSAIMTPSGSYDELTDRALVDLGPDWEIVDL
jgi:hypothetical protein